MASGLHREDLEIALGAMGAPWEGPGRGLGGAFGAMGEPGRVPGEAEEATSDLSLHFQMFLGPWTL